MVLNAIKYLSIPNGVVKVAGVFSEHTLYYNRKVPVCVCLHLRRYCFWHLYLMMKKIEIYIRETVRNQNYILMTHLITNFWRENDIYND